MGDDDRQPIPPAVHRLGPADPPADQQDRPLIEVYQGLKNKYRNYDTRLALKRMQGFRRTVQELSQKGFPIALELLGSINFGIVEPISDADLIILHSCDLHMGDGECAPHCPNLLFERDEILKGLRRHLKEQTCNIEILDCINLKYIDQLVAENRVHGESLVYRFMFYRNMGRPVNRPLFIRYYEQLSEIDGLLAEFNKWASIALRAYLSTSDHRHSFNKYNERILNQRLSLPEELREELKSYLEDQ